MSLVVAIKENGKVYVGADSQVTRGGTRSTLKNPNNYKIWQVGNTPACLMAHVGNVRDANIVRLMDDLVTDYDVYQNRVGYRYVVKQVVPEIVKALREAGYLKDDKYLEHTESRYLFIYKDQLFLINTDGCVLEIDDYAAIGSGEDQAIGSLLSSEGEDPETRIIKAIKAGAASDIYVDYPIILTDSESMKFKVITDRFEEDIEKPAGKAEEANHQ